MSFVSSIVSGIGHAVSAVADVGKSVISGISSAIGPISDVAALVTGNPELAALGNIGGAVGTALTGSGGVTSGLGGLINDISNFNTSSASGVASSLGGIIGDTGNIIKSFLDPVQKEIDQITKLVTELNDNLVAPFSNLINGSIGGLNTIITDFHKDIGNGVSGLVKFSADLAAQLNGIDAIVGRSLQQLGTSNAELINSVLVPAFGGIGSKGFDALVANYQSVSGAKYEAVAAFSQVQLQQSVDVTGADKGIDSVFSALRNNDLPFGWLIKLFGDFIEMYPMFQASIDPYKDAYRQYCYSRQPTATLGLGDVMTAYFRGILSEADAQAEFARQGVNASRFSVLKENFQWLPGIGETLRLQTRGAITDATASATLKKLGLTDEDIKAVTESYLNPIDPRLYEGGQSRQAAGVKGFLTASYTLPPPPEYIALFPPNGLQTERASLEWANHWHTPNLDWWITAYYKGFRTQEEVTLAAGAENVPPEVIKDLIEVWGETIQLWMIPDMMATGVFNEQTARDYLHYIGMDTRSIDPIIQYGFIKAKSSTASNAADLKAISAANAKTMYTDGIIDQATYTEILVEHGYSQEAAALEVALTDQSNALAARKAEATAIVNQVNLGIIDEQTAISQLYSLGYTDNEVLSYIKHIKQTKAANAKLPSEAQLTKMLKAGVIDQPTYLNTLQLLGYSQFWANAILAIS